MNRIKSEINLANAKKTREIIENLREQGLLRNLGNFSGPEIEKKIEELTDLLPYSKEFLHVRENSPYLLKAVFSWYFASTIMTTK